MTQNYKLKSLVRQALEEQKLVIERAKGRWTESDVTLRSGKTAKFGSKGHVKDLERVLDDLARIRQRQVGGSATRAHLSSAISSLRKELKKARKRLEMTQPVSIVEE